MRRDRIIAGTSCALSLLIGAWQILQWTEDKPAPLEARPAPEHQLQKPAETAARPHLQAVLLPPPPAPAPAPAPTRQAKAAPVPKPQPIKAMPLPLKAKPRIEPLQSSPKPALKPVMTNVLKPVPLVPSPKPVASAKHSVQKPPPPEPDMQAFRSPREAPLKAEKFDALARFKAQRAAQKQAQIQNQERAKPAPAKPTKPTKIEVSAKAATSGRVALRILEHGEGPEIELAWPNSVSTSNRLYRRFIACYGMKTAVMDGSGQLYTATGGANPWRINLDRYSGFVRQVSGRLSPQESTELRALQRLRRSKVSSVHIFPRSVDARLLGGLGQLLGKSYRSMGHIRASYRMTPSGVSVGEITADGHAVAGEIILRPVTRRCSA
jgi:hypothetical protein